jgi:hypothetical protein
MKNCMTYTHSNPKGQQFGGLPSLPQSGRAGGALLLIKRSRSLLWAAGATRSDPNDIWNTTDYHDVWELPLTNVSSGWKAVTPIPYLGNHISYVAVPYRGGERYYVFGGQRKEDEIKGNQVDVYEYLPTAKKWMRRDNMTLARGHSSSSTVPLPSCGFITAGGAVNNPHSSKLHLQTKDISYYDINANRWFKIGDLPAPVNTPICDITTIQRNVSYLYCQTGRVEMPYNYRIKIKWTTM